MSRRFRKHTILPGFGLAMGFTVFYLSLIVLIPLGATFLKTFTGGWSHFWEAVSGARALASTSNHRRFVDCGDLNAVLGCLLPRAGSLQFPRQTDRRRLVDLPFAFADCVAALRSPHVCAKRWVAVGSSRLGHQGAVPGWGGWWR